MELEEEKVSSPILICQVKNLPGEGIWIDGEVPFDELGLESDDRFTLDGPIRFRLHVVQAQQDIIVQGSLQADIHAVCDRCAEEAPCHLEAPNVLYRYKNLLGEPIDLTEAVREDILLTFPLSFHCCEDCKGLCPTCGQNLNEGPCACKAGNPDDDREDPWKALSGLKLN